MEKRKEFRHIGGAHLGSAGSMTTSENGWVAQPEEVVIERDVPGKPHKNKVFAAIHANLKDIPYYAGGTCAKLIDEGYTGYIIRTSNDEQSGEGSSFQNILSNEQEHVKMARVVGFADIFDLYYCNHRLDNDSILEIRGRLIFLFRLLKVDTVITYIPFGFDEENPDQWVTGRAVAQACLMSGLKNHYPEHFEVVQPYTVKERYYAVGTGQPFNRIVDISSTIERKIDAIVECKSQGGGSKGSLLRKRLTSEGRRLPILGNDDSTANREYVRNFLLTPYKRLGEQFNLSYAECFNYIDERTSEEDELVEEYIKKSAVEL